MYLLTFVVWFPSPVQTVQVLLGGEKVGDHTSSEDDRFAVFVDASGIYFLWIHCTGKNGIIRIIRKSGAKNQLCLDARHGGLHLAPSEKKERANP